MNKQTVLVHMASVNNLKQWIIFNSKHTISTSNSSFIASFECLSVCIKRIALRESKFTLWWEVEEKMPKHIHIPFITCVKGLMINYKLQSQFSSQSLERSNLEHSLIISSPFNMQLHFFFTCVCLCAVECMCSIASVAVAVAVIFVVN